MVLRRYHATLNSFTKTCSQDCEVFALLRLRLASSTGSSNTTLTRFTTGFRRLGSPCSVGSWLLGSDNPPRSGHFDFITWIFLSSIFYDNLTNLFLSLFELIWVPKLSLHKNLFVVVVSHFLGGTRWSKLTPWDRERSPSFWSLERPTSASLIWWTFFAQLKFGNSYSVCVAQLFIFGRHSYLFL